MTLVTFYVQEAVVDVGGSSSKGDRPGQFLIIHSQNEFLSLSTNPCPFPLSLTASSTVGHTFFFFFFKFNTIYEFFPQALPLVVFGFCFIFFINNFFRYKF